MKNIRKLEYYKLNIVDNSEEKEIGRYIEIMTSEQVSENNDKQCRRLACNRGCFATRIMGESSSHLNEDMVRLNVLWRCDVVLF